MKNSRNVTPGAPSPNDRPAQRSRQGQGGGNGRENQKNRSVGTEDTVSGTQEVEKIVASSGNETTDNFLTVEELESSVEKWLLSPEEQKQFEEGSDSNIGGWLPAKSNRGRRASAVTDVEVVDRTTGTVQKVSGQRAHTETIIAPGNGVEECKISEDGSSNMLKSPPRRARFSERDETAEILRRENKRKPGRVSATRYDLKLILPPTDPSDALEALKMVLIEVWEKIKEADKTTIIYPWSNKEAAQFPGLTKTSDLPSTVPAIQEYFNRAFPRKTGGVMYVSVYLGHDRPFKDLHSEIDWWLAQQGYGWYKKALQCEKSVVIGWLLYSTIDMDREILAAEIFKATGVTVGLRFRTISVNSKESLSKDQLVGAIHVEIDERNYFGDKARIEDLYKADREANFPLDIKVRLCPQVQDASDPSSTVKFERLRIRQAAFLANVYKTLSGDIGVLDFVDEKLEGKSLRNLIMNIRDEEGTRIFVSVDRHFLGRGFVFQYTSKFQTLAPAWIRGLLPFLKSQVDQSLHEQLQKCFTMDAIKRSLAYVWDTEKRCVVSAADRLIDDLLEGYDLDEEFEFPDTDTTKFELDITEVKRAGDSGASDLFGGKSGVNPYDMDSVLTMVSRHAKKAASTTTRIETQTKKKKEKAEKTLDLKAITVRLRDMEMQLERALNGPNPSPRPGQAKEPEVLDVGDGDGSDDSFA